MNGGPFSIVQPEPSSDRARELRPTFEPVPVRENQPFDLARPCTMLVVKASAHSRNAAARSTSVLSRSRSRSGMKLILNPATQRILRRLFKQAVQPPLTWLNAA